MPFALYLLALAVFVMGTSEFMLAGLVPAIADRLTTLLKDPDLARKMGTAGRAWVEENWRWETQANHLARLLNP